MLGSSDYDQTAKFCSAFDRFFDCLNTRSASEGKKSRKPDLDPYRSVDDKRFDVCVSCWYRIIPCLINHCIYTTTFQWLQNDFMGYLDNWEKAVKEREGFSDQEKKKMLLSAETLEGLRMTGIALSV